MRCHWLVKGSLKLVFRHELLPSAYPRAVESGNEINQEEMKRHAVDFEKSEQGDDEYGDQSLQNKQPEVGQTEFQEEHKTARHYNDKLPHGQGAYYLVFYVNELWHDELLHKFTEALKH